MNSHGPSHGSLLLRVQAKCEALNNLLPRHGITATPTQEGASVSLVLEEDDLKILCLLLADTLPASAKDVEEVVREAKKLYPGSTIKAVQHIRHTLNVGLVEAHAAYKRY